MQEDQASPPISQGRYDAAARQRDAEALQRLYGIVSEYIRRRALNESDEAAGREKDERGRRSLYGRILDVTDQMHAELKSLTSPNWGAGDDTAAAVAAVRDRMTMVLDTLRRRLLGALALEGVIERDVAKVNAPVDFTWCEVVDVQDRDDLDEFTIVELVRPAYAIGPSGKVLRRADVIVSRRPLPAGADEAARDASLLPSDNEGSDDHGKVEEDAFGTASDEGA